MAWTLSFNPSHSGHVSFVYRMMVLFPAAAAMVTRLVAPMVPVLAVARLTAPEDRLPRNRARRAPSRTLDMPWVWMTKETAGENGFRELSSPALLVFD